MKRANGAAAMIFAAGCLWGTSGLFVNALTARGASPALISFLRVGLAFVLQAGITAARLGVRALIIPRRALLGCALLGLVCQGLFNLCYNSAIPRAGVMVSAVLLYLAPLFTAIAARLLFREAIGARRRLALAVNLVGCALAATGGQLALAGASFAGILLGVGAGFCYAMNPIIGRLAGERTHAFVINTYAFLFGGLFLLLFTHPFDGAPALTPGLAIWALLYALVPTLGAYMLYFPGIQRIGEASRVPVIASVEAVVAAATGILLFGEALTPLRLLGILLVLASIRLSSAPAVAAERKE